MDISQLFNGYRNKEFSPTEITKKYFSRIEKNLELNAYITLSADKALQQAEISEKKIMAGEVLGALEGIPLSIKDNIETKDIVTTNGSKVLKNSIPNENAYVVERVLSEGAINLGKTNLPEFVFGVTGNNPHYGYTKNPWNHNYSPGGSSAGSAAAIAANLCVASIGTDTTGSIRIPASSCGLVGLKPTFSYINTKGVKPHSWSLDNVGPLAKNVTDIAWMMEALTGDQYKKYCMEDIKGVRIGVPKNYFNENIDQDVMELFENSLLLLEKQGAILIEIDIPFSNADIEQLSHLVFSETAYSHRKNIEKYGHLIGDYIKNLLSPGFSATSFEYINGFKTKKKIERDFDKMFETIDVLATPTLPVPPPKLETTDIHINDFVEDILDSMTRYVQVFNFSNQPAMSIPCGITTDYLPVGMQLAARSYEDQLLIKVGYAFEQSNLNDFYSKREKICRTYSDA